MPRKTPAQRAEAAIASLLKQLDRARGEVARLEGEVARITGSLGGAVPVRPVVRMPILPPPEPEIPSAEPGELASEDNLGDGRWV